MLAISWTYLQLPALRVENGSRDFCDPFKTYGELSQQGMHTVSRLFQGAGGKIFLDVGSGRGHFVLWAAAEGFNESRGVEAVHERHLEATRRAQGLQGAARQAVSLIHGDILEHLELLRAHLVLALRHVMCDILICMSICILYIVCMYM